jgi:nicotinamide-nucleotide amidase
MAEGMLTGPAAAEAGEKLGLTLAVTGIAGPGGGSAEKPEGLVHFAAARRGALTLHAEERFGAPGRNRVRQLSVARALALGLEALAPN